MARSRRRRRSPAVTRNAVVASAVRIGAGGPSGRSPGRPKGTQNWQQEAWYFLDTCGELSFAAQWFANALSRVRLFIERSNAAEGESEVTAGPAVDALAGLFGGASGQSQMMASFGVHLFTPGEAWLVGFEDTTTGRDVWGVYSTDEVKQVKGTSRWELDRGDGVTRVLDTSDEAVQPAVVIRIWRSHPRLWVEATSPVRAVLPVLRELEGLTKHIGATIDSRLAGAGLLLLPSEMTFGSPPGPPTVDTGVPGTEQGAPPADDPNQDPFLVQLTEAMVTPIRDRENASAVVPLVVRAPGAVLANAQHIKFSTPLDDKAIDLRAECIRRLALGLDLPPEVLLGQADSNHWSAWQIDEAAIKVHIEPLCELICNALTERYLWPVLGAEEGETSDLQIAADTSDLRLRPNRSTEAFELYDRLAIDAAALRRETGFDEGDEPDFNEQTRQLLLKVAGGTTTPEVTNAALAALGVNLTPEPSPEQPPETPAAPPETPAVEPAEDNRDIPQAAALLAACEPLVYRALERANNRCNNRAKTRRPIPQDRMDEAMRGAFDPPLVASICRALDCDPDALTHVLNRYTTVLLATGKDHAPDVLARLLDTRPGLYRRALAVGHG